jgi:hypothetical protein
MACKCEICKHGRKYYRIINKLPPAQKKWMSRFYDVFLNNAEDLEYKAAIMDGWWPSAVEQLTVALAKANAIRLKEKKQ